MSSTYPAEVGPGQAKVAHKDTDQTFKEEDAVIAQPNDAWGNSYNMLVLVRLRATVCPDYIASSNSTGSRDHLVKQATRYMVLICTRRVS